MKKSNNLNNKLAGKGTAGKVKSNLPQHIAIIPDGNRRWAYQKGLEAWRGHQRGVRALENILEASHSLKIPYLTFWGGSLDNFEKRPKKELRFLFKLYQEQFRRIIDDKRIEQDKVRVNVLGRWEQTLPFSTRSVIKKAIEKTRSYHNYFLTFLLAYNGTDEMTVCFQKIADLSRQKRIKISENLIKKNLWTGSLPPVDLVIRTGVSRDPHLSAGFMMWQTAYAQLCFSKTLFPDFKTPEFNKIIRNYSSRERRLGS